MDEPDNISAEDREWLELLAGRAQPKRAGPHAVQAAQLRAYFTRYDEQFANPARDPASEARMLQRLDAAGVLAAPAAQAPAQAPRSNRLLALLDWLFPPANHGSLRYVGLALAFVVMGLNLPPLSAPPDIAIDEAPRPRTKGFTRPATQGTVVILHDAPDVLAAHIASVLRSLQVEVTLTQQGRDVALRATVAPAQRLLVRERLATWGIEPAGDGAVRVDFKPQ